MQTELYLDTARFGRMVPGARGALEEFAGLCTDEGGSLHLLDILRGPIGPGAVGSWRGHGDLKASVRALVNAPGDSPVFPAQRSATLARVVARAAFRRCERLLCTDLEWPRYRASLGEEARRLGREVACLPARDLILRDGVGRDELVRALARAFRQGRCDGLFLSDVTFEGIRLPVAALLEELADSRSLRFVAVDGAQAVGHVPCDLGRMPCDVYLGGCHKWIGAGQTLAFLVCPRARSLGLVESVLGEMVGTGEVDDPLLLLLGELEGAASPSAGDTADLSCLFSGSAALAHAKSGSMPGQDATLRANAERVRELGGSRGWRPPPIDRELGTGIQLLEAVRAETRRLPAESLRRNFQDRGIALTAFAGGLLRLSMPRAPIEPGSLVALGAAPGRPRLGDRGRRLPGQDRAELQGRLVQRPQRTAELARLQLIQDPVRLVVGHDGPDADGRLPSRA